MPWRPPGNRTPTPQETAICLPFIRRQIELANPDFVVCLGGPAMQTLLAVKDGITRTRGRWFPYDTGTREIRALATFHPAFLLRSPLQKRFAWRDFLALKKALGSACYLTFMYGSAAGQKILAWRREHVDHLGVLGKEGLVLDVAGDHHDVARPAALRSSPSRNSILPLSM